MTGSSGLHFCGWLWCLDGHLGAVQQQREDRRVLTRGHWWTVLPVERGKDPLCKGSLGILVKVYSVFQQAGVEVIAVDGGVLNELHVVGQVYPLLDKLVEQVCVNLHIYLFLGKILDGMLFLSATLLDVPGLRADNQNLARETHDRPGEVSKRLHLLDKQVGVGVGKDTRVGEMGGVAVTVVGLFEEHFVPQKVVNYHVLGCALLKR